MTGRPQPPTIGARIKKIEEALYRLQRRDYSTARQPIVPVALTWATTASGGWTDLFQLDHLQQNATLLVQCFAMVSGGATAELALFDFDNNAFLTSARPVTSATQTQVRFDAIPYPGQVGDIRQINLRGRIADGAGTLSVRVQWAYSAAPSG